MNSLNKLQVGIKTFQENTFHEKQNVFSKLKNSQDPKICVVTCADSRISPSLITNSEPGDLFVIRNAGNIISAPNNGTGEIASIEYCVEVLNIEHIVIMGHSNCGAMNGILNIKDLPLPHVCSWLRQSGLEQAYIDSLEQIEDPQERLEQLTKKNILQQIKNLKQCSFMDGKNIEIHGWLYHIAEGKIEAHNSAKDEWQLLEIENIELDM